MNVRYRNQQDKSDPMNDAVISETEHLSKLFEDRRKCMPFLASLDGDNGYELMIGLGSGVGWAQHSRQDGELPYLVAVPTRQRVRSGYVEFLINNTPTPMRARNILNFDEVKQIALHFLATGERDEAFTWDSI